jgi:arrestin-related trafficking adapter 3/6
MRLSKPDQNDPAKRRHFEISIDSPFHILSCQAAASFTALPAYGSASQKGGETYVCGCPDAPRRPTNAHGVHTLSPLSNGAETHSRQSLSNVALQNTQRPIHMIRAPSYNPPAFDDDVPPPLITPPPHYDSIVSNQNPLADYFSRLAELDLDSVDEDDMTSPRSRVAVPLTPGGRVNRSMDERRTWTPIGDPA